MEQKGSFIGFTFGNRHSSKLGIFRTSDSNRYSQNLAPKMKEQTADLATRDGIYYFGSNYTSREIPISFAFYGMTEEQISQLKQVFNDKKIHDLILDEEPYKVWSAKLTGTAVCKHLCFEREGQRFYCGEGTFLFTTYYPFARSRYEYIEDYTLETVYEWIDNDRLLVSEFEDGIIYPAILTYDESYKDTGSIIGYESLFEEWLEDTNLLTDSDLDFVDVNSSIHFFIGNGPYYNLDEWRRASKIPSRSEGYGGYSDGKYKLLNAGDLPMPFKLYLPINTAAQGIEIYIDGADPKFSLKLDAVAAKAEDKYILIDTGTRMIRGCDDNFKPNKNLYNKYILEGDFFELPVGETQLVAPCGEGCSLEFKYLYL